MKNSGIEWIGELPDSWEVNLVKNIFDITRGRVIAKTEIEDEPLEGYYPVYSSQTANSGILGYIPSYDFAIDSLTWTTDGAKAGTVFLRRGKYSITNVCGILTLKSKKYSLDYLNYAVGFSAYNCRRADINGYKIMSNEMAIIPIVVPYLEEQQRIAKHLDEKCGKIDELIANQEKQIEKLKEYKQSVITDIAIGGINSDAQKKESNITWIGMVPVSWELKPFKHILKERQEKNMPVQTEERLSLSIDLGVTLYAEKTTNLDRFKDDFSQYKLAHEGDLVFNSMNMIVGAIGMSNYFGCVSPAYYTFYEIEKDFIKVKYLEYLFRSKTMRKVLHGMGKGIYAIERGDDRINTCRLKVPREDLRSMILPLPPSDEMRKIVEFLNTKSEQIDRLIAIKQEKIEKLNEYKKSLIYEYVTGKKEVV